MKVNDERTIDRRTVRQRPAPPGGRPLPAELQVPMERYFGHDFSTIRIHADDAAERHGALAFAQGSAIHLRHSAPDIATPEGRRLIGHELAHVVQQREGRVPQAVGAAPINDSALLEADADLHGERAVAGAPPRPAVAAGSITNVAANPPIQRVVFKIKKSGKVKYAPDDGFTAPPPGYLRMADADFAIWKGAGKRRPSNKMMDSRTGERYVATPHGFCGLLNKMPQMHQPMPPHAVVVDRTRPDRSAQQSPLLPFDVGGYHSGASLGAVTYPRTPDVQKRWEGERDHSPSGASLKLRQAKQMDRPKAYSQGVTMAIDTRMHADHSPTHSHHQQTVDEVVDQHGVTTQQKRLQVDRAHPAVALHRDMFEILAGTRNQNWNTPGVHTVGQPRLDLTDRNNRLVQHGAYRTKYRANTRMNEFLGNDRGVNPKDPAYKLTRLPATVGKKKKGKLPTAKRPYRLTRIPHQMQGDRTRLKFGRTLRKEHYLL